MRKIIVYLITVTDKLMPALGCVIWGIFFERLSSTYDGVSDSNISYPGGALI